MPLLGRSDGVYLRRLPGFRKIFPFLMPTRTESTIGYQQTLRAGPALALLARLNHGRSEGRFTLFHVVLAAAVRTLALRPENNRFVVGRRIYQRRAIELGFVTKKELTEKADETNVKLAFQPGDTLEDVAARVRDAVGRTRKTRESSDEKTSRLMTRMPRFLTRLLMWGWRVLDYWNLLPAGAIRGDSLYASAYLANLGGIGLDAVQHHLFEWGTCSFFVVLGRVKKAALVTPAGELSVEDALTISYTIDERITDGVNLARTVSTLAGCIEEPEQLLAPPAELPDPYAKA